MAVFDQNVHQRVVTPSELIEELEELNSAVQLDQSCNRTNGRRATTALDLEPPKARAGVGAVSPVAMMAGLSRCRAASRGQHGSAL